MDARVRLKKLLIILLKTILHVENCNLLIKSPDSRMHMYMDIISMNEQYFPNEGLRWRAI